jgi:anti-sigma-K factor RskA
MSDPRKRVHTLLTDGAVAGLSRWEREELETLLAGESIDPSYEHAASAIELALLDHTEVLPIELEAAVVQQAGRYFGFAAVRPREPTLGADADATPVRRIWERSPDNIDENAVLESSLTNGRLDRVGSGESLREEILPASDEPVAERQEDRNEAQRAQKFDSEVDAQLEALEHRPSLPVADDDEDQPFDIDDDDDEPAPPPDERKPAKRPRKRSQSKPVRDQQAPEEPQPIPPARDNPIARWATYVSAIAALLLLVVALWLFAGRDGAIDPDALAEDIEASDDKLEWKFVAKSDPLVGDGAGGSILWSSKLQAGVMTLHGLAPNDPTDEQYQLWIVDRERKGPPVDGGVFDVPAGEDELRIPVNAKLLIGDPAAFMITVERAGGVVVSAQDRVAMVAASD